MALSTGQKELHHAIAFRAYKFVVIKGESAKLEALQDMAFDKYYYGAMDPDIIRYGRKYYMNVCNHDHNKHGDKMLKSLIILLLCCRVPIIVHPNLHRK